MELYYSNNPDYKRSDKIINNHIKNFETNRLNINNIVGNIIILLEQRTPQNIFLVGVGKSGLVCQKCVATWRSLGIKCHYLDVINLFHGDFGVLNTGDIVIFISNSGNTVELVNAAKYISEMFSITKIGIVSNTKCKLDKYIDHMYKLYKITEADDTIMVPTTSSLIFMSLLDSIGLILAEKRGLTKELFQIYHPGGELGKK